MSTTPRREWDDIDREAAEQGQALRRLREFIKPREPCTGDGPPITNENGSGTERRSNGE